jgi:hypothetical protein
MLKNRFDAKDIRSNLDPPEQLGIGFVTGHITGAGGKFTV